ncbi:MAG: hypothetical protein LBI35_03295 [Burkholderiales bacterium]|jgi:hypothetical protein|nr:hypothetical protein [Burkholderiales bacterium]
MGEIKKHGLVGASPVLLVAFVACAGTLWVFYPGFMTFDSALGLWLARHGEGFGMTPQIVTFIWRLMLPLDPSSGAPLFVLDNILFWLSLCIFALTLFRAWYARLLFLVFCGLLSPCVLILAHMWSDAMLVGALSLACALIFLSAMGHGKTWAILALPFLMLAGLMRFNVFPALFPIICYWWYVMLAGVLKTWRLPARCAVLLTVTVALLTGIFSVNKALEKRFVTIPMSAWAVVALWDLAAISIATGEIRVPSFAMPPTTTLKELREHFRGDSNTPIYTVIHDNGSPSPYTPAQLKEINRTLLTAIIEHPKVYLEHRWRLTRYLFGRYNHEKSLTFYAGILPYGDNPPRALSENTLRDRVIGFYREAVKTWWSAPVVYVVISLLLLPLFWQQRHSEQGKYAFMLTLSGLLYVAPLCLVAPSAELRYFSWLFFTAPVGVAVLFPMLKQRYYPVAQREGKKLV